MLYGSPIQTYQVLESWWDRLQLSLLPFHLARQPKPLAHNLQQFITQGLHFQHSALTRKFEQYFLSLGVPVRQWHLPVGF